MYNVIFVIFSMLGSSYAVIYRLNDSQHDLMPPIVHLDSFERCLRKPAGVYCTGFINFVSDEPSALLMQMQEYSEYNIRHFNYTRALYGTCISDKCKLERKTTLRSTLEACLNRTVWNNYKLKVKIESEIHCIGGSSRKASLDSAGIAMIVVCLTLLVFNAVGSLYDFYFSGKKPGPVAYLLLCFSLRRNWKNLVASSDNNKDPREIRLQGMHGIRAMSMIMVVLAHAAMFPMIISDSQIFFEMQYDIVVVHLLMNGSLIMQTFLILSSFLLVYNSLKAEEKHNVSWMTLPRKILKRWLRLTPSYAIVLGVTATWLKNIGDGPLWEHLVMTESKHCRREWWKHLLHINNYFDTSQCMPQAWYLAADFQLYCLGMTIYVFCRSPKSRNLVLSSLFLIGVMLPGLHTYFQDLDAAVIVRPNAAMTAFVEDPTFNHVYKRAHTNIPSYMLGLALGYLVYSLQKNSSDNSNYKKWRLVYWAMFPMSFGMIMLCKLFYAEGPRMDVCWRAVIASIIRPSFGITMAVILAGTVLKIENLYRRVLEWSGWTTVSRVSYSAYLLHVAFVRVLGGMQTTTVPGTYISVTQTILLMMVLTYVSAYVFYLTVESPLNQLVKLCMEPKAGQKNERSE